MQVLGDYAETKIDYAEGTRFGSIKASDTCSLLITLVLTLVNQMQQITAQSASVQTVADWYNSQTLDLDNALYSGNH